MSALSGYAVVAILNGTPIPATLYLKAHISEPGVNGLNGAASETSRVAVTRTTAVYPGVASNDAEVGWTNYPADETITHLTLWDDLTAGNCWFIGEETGGGIAVLTGQDLTLDVGDLVFTAVIYVP